MPDERQLTQTLISLQAASPQHVAQYELLRQVGAGAMGVVYQARDVDLDRFVAIKLLHQESVIGSDKTRVQRFFREARSAAQLSHPNVAQVYQIGQHEEQPFIAMEWLDGLDLSAWVRQHGAMPWPEALMAIGDAAAALAAAHQAGLVHRDIKPSNLVRLRSGQVKVVDFGLARRHEMDSELTATGAILGTPAYLSPEQCMGSEATPLSDLYSLGCTLVQLLTGAPPFEANNPIEILHKHAYEPMPDIGERVPGLPPALVKLVRRATAKDPMQRQTSAEALQAELHAVLDGQGVSSTLLDTSPPLPDDPSTAATLPGNLPQELSSFVGRRALIAQAWGQFGQTRLLDLVGPGGTGKTRLALRLARLAARRFAEDGVWWLDLAPLPAGHAVHAALAQLMSIRDSQGLDLQASVIAHFKTRHALIVFDNCEHVLESAALLAARLLEDAPGVQIIATSRQPLGVPGETAFAVQPMQLCEADAPTAELVDNEAVQLFATRARSLRTSFALDRSNAAAVAEICRRLDGIPLAIELAAARINVLTPAQIASRLSDLFKLLTGGQRALLPRQQTLRALIDWSYELLLPEQRLLFARLAVFQGDFDLGAAEALLPDTALPAEAVLDGVGELVNRSLVVAAERDGEMRYHLLQTIRQYAAERLAGEASAPALRQRHVEHYAQALALESERLDGTEVAAAKVAMGRLLDNARAAFDGALAHGWLEQALALATAMARYDQHRGILAESVARTERLLALHPAPSAALAQLLKGAGSLALRLARSDLARAWFERGLVIADELKDEALRSELLRNLGNLAYRAEDYDLAVFHYEQALAVAGAAGDTRSEAHALVNLAAVMIEQARPAQAKEYLLPALEIYRAAGNLRAQASLLGNLGIVDHDLGNSALGRQHFHDSIERHEAINDHRGAAISRCQLGACLIAEGDFAAAQAAVEPAVEALRRFDDRPTLAAALDWLARALFHQRQESRALALARESLALRRASGSRNDVGDSLELFAEFCVAGAPERAASLLGAAAELRAQLGISLQARDLKDIEAIASDIRGRIGEALFAERFGEGRANGLDAALQRL